MALTDNCNLFFSVNEGGANRIVGHIMNQRPSLFNYATADVAANRELWCKVPEFTADVPLFGNPIFTVLPFLPVIGADSPPVGLGFCAQVTRAEIDFHPGDTIPLPPELKLDEQQFSIGLTICGGIGCPDPRLLERIPVFRPDRGKEDQREKPREVDVPGKMNCFCLDVFVTAHFERETVVGTECLVGKVDGVEIVDVGPEGLESIMECYIRTVIVLFLRQKLSIPFETLFLDFPLLGLGSVLAFPTPTPPVAHNPAVEEDQLKAFISLTF